MENRITSWIGFILFSLAAAYTHYFCLISVSFFYLAIIIAALVRRKDFFKKTMIACLVTVIGYFPWFLVLLKTVSRVSKDFWITEWNLPNWDECMNYIFNGRFCRLLLWVWIFSIIIFVLYETNIIRVKKQGECCILRFEISEVRKTKTLLWVFAGLASVFGTVLIGLLVSEFMRPIFVLRYMYPVTAVAYFLLTYC